MLTTLILPKSAAAGIIAAQLLFINIVKYIQFKVQFNIKFAEIMRQIAKSMPMQISVSSPPQHIYQGIMEAWQMFFKQLKLDIAVCLIY